MTQINIQYYETPYGELILGSYQGKLCLCDWRYRSKRDAVDSRIQKGLKAAFIERNDNVLMDVRRQLHEYLNQTRHRFEVPLVMVGTVFQNAVWTHLLDIPLGQTSSYLQLAERIGNPNAISIIIPCHRIIGSNGKLVVMRVG